MDEKIRTLEEQLKSIDSDPQPDPAAKIKVLNDLAWELRYVDPTRSYQLCQHIQELLERHPHPFEQAKHQTTLVELIFRKGNYQQALLLGNAAMRLVEQVGLDYLQPLLRSTLGGIHWRLGNLPEALTHFQQQYRTAQQLGDKKSEAASLNNIALIQEDSGDLAAAISTLQQALVVYEALQDQSGQALTLNNLAMAQYSASDYATALANALKSLKLAQIVGNQLSVLTILDTIGLIHLKQHDYASARTCFQQSLELADKNGLTADKAIARLSIGQLYALQGEDELALSQLHKALRHLEAIDQKPKLFECHQLLSEIYERQGDLGKALQHYKQYHLVKEQVFNETADHKLKNLRISHEVETLKKESEIHRLKNVELQAVLEHVKQLSGLLPICASCKKIRDDTGYWQDVAVYIREHSEADFSHGICPECEENLYSELRERRKNK